MPYCRHCGRRLYGHETCYKCLKEFIARRKEAWESGLHKPVEPTTKGKEEQDDRNVRKYQSRKTTWEQDRDSERT